MAEENDSWLPNLVGGVSIWKLAPDLNEEQFFDGRLLVPETEGSDSLPARVEWDLTGLVPLAEARAEYPARVEKATEDFFACLERTAEVFEKGGSGYDKYKEAFTVPAPQLEQHFLHSINDGFVSGANTQAASAATASGGCGPKPSKHGVTVGLHRLPAALPCVDDGGARIVTRCTPTGTALTPANSSPVVHVAVSIPNVAPLGTSRAT